MCTISFVIVLYNSAMLGMEEEQSGERDTGIFHKLRRGIHERTIGVAGVSRPCGAFVRDKTAVYCGERVFTYRELNGRVNRLSHGLKDLGIEKGERVAYLAPNTLEMLEGFYGIFQLGAVMVPLNIWLTPADYLLILNHSELKVLFVDQDLYHLIVPIKDKLEMVEHIIAHYKDESCNEIGYDTGWTGFRWNRFRVPIWMKTMCAASFIQAVRPGIRKA